MKSEETRNILDKLTTQQRGKLKEIEMLNEQISQLQSKSQNIRLVLQADLGLTYEEFSLLYVYFKNPNF